MLGRYLLCAALLFQADSRPLPDLKQFLTEFQKNLHTDDLLLSQYTYNEKRTHIELGSNDEPKKTTTDTYQVTRGADGSIYRRLVSKNGQSVKLTKPEKVYARSRKDEEKIINDVFAGYDMRIIGREDVDGRPAIRIEFNPRRDYNPNTREGRIMRRVAGQAWVDEADHQLVRLDAEAIDTISIGFGLLAKLQKGAKIQAERRKVNNEAWLPSQTEVSLSARILLLKGLHLREVREYSDYKKFNVETVIKI